jgi:hypothetical protein
VQGRRPLPLVPVLALALAVALTVPMLPTLPVKVRGDRCRRLLVASHAARSNGSAMLSLCIV